MRDDSRQDKLIREAAEWRLISLLFECPSIEWHEQVSELAAETTDTQLKKAARSAKTEATEGTYHSIFGPGGPAPAREVTYRSWVQPGYLLSELSAFYKAFSYSPKTDEIFDHIAVETGFIAYLRLKQAYALACSDDEHAKITARAAKEFTAEHLSKSAEQLKRSLAFSGVEYLALASSALFKRVGKDKDKRTRSTLPVMESVVEDDFGCDDAPPEELW